MGTIHLLIGSPDNRTICPITKSAHQRGRIIQPTGMIDVISVAAATTSWSAQHTTSDITGYRVLSLGLPSETELTASCTPALACESLIEEFATDAGAMDGVFCNGATMNWTFYCKYSSPGAASIRRLICRVYHRTEGGSETEIASFEQDVTDTFTGYEVPVTITQEWGTNERLVAKYYGYFEIVV